MKTWKPPVIATIGKRSEKGRVRGRGIAMGNKRQISHMIGCTLLDRTDALSHYLGESRATVINRAVLELLERQEPRMFAAQKRASGSD